MNNIFQRRKHQCSCGRPILKWGSPLPWCQPDSHQLLTVIAVTITVQSTFLSFLQKNLGHYIKLRHAATPTSHILFSCNCIDVMIGPTFLSRKIPFMQFSFVEVYSWNATLSCSTNHKSPGPYLGILTQYF